MNLLEIMGLLCAGGLVLYGLLYCLIRAAESATTSHLRRSRVIRAAPPSASEQRLAACGLASVANEILATSQRMQPRIEALKTIRIANDQTDPAALLGTTDDLVRYSMLVPDRMRTMSSASDNLHRHTARLNDALHVLRALDEVLRLKCRSLQAAEEFPARTSEAP